MRWKSGVSNLIIIVTCFLVLCGKAKADKFPGEWTYTLHDITFCDWYSWWYNYPSCAPGFEGGSARGWFSIYYDNEGYPTFVGYDITVSGAIVDESGTPVVMPASTFQYPPPGQPGQWAALYNACVGVGVGFSYGYNSNRFDLALDRNVYDVGTGPLYVYTSGSSLSECSGFYDAPLPLPPGEEADIPIPISGYLTDHPGGYTPIPEPGTLALLGTGLMALAGTIRQKR